MVGYDPKNYNTSTKNPHLKPRLNQNILEMLPYEMIDVVPGELGAVLLGLGPLAVVLSLEPPEMLHKLLPQEILT